MKIKNNRSKKRNFKPIVIIGALLLLAVLTVAAISFKQHADLAEKKNQESIQQNTDIKNEANQTSGDKTTNEIPEDTTLAASIDDLYQEGDTIHFTGSVNTPNGKGTCTVVFSNENDKPVTRTVDATSKGDNTVCGPVEISNLEFSFVGTWQVTFRYFENDTQVSTEGTIDIK